MTADAPVIIGSHNSGAHFSVCGDYRYSLWRRWVDNCPLDRMVAFIGLNPSTADAVKNDTTISKCIGFAQRWGYGGIYMLNLYAFRATDPKVMCAAADPWGDKNLESFGYYRSRVGLVVACWGSLQIKHRPNLRWQSTIQSVLGAIGKPVYCLGKTVDQSPRHPSRLAYATERQLFWEPAP